MENEILSEFLTNFRLNQQSFQQILSKHSFFCLALTLNTCLCSKRMESMEKILDKI